ncbi:RNB-domain-containing protein [Salix suchowensis]|nr:RNB-domain-containing protein [Salix suchowensis]
MTDEINPQTQQQLPRKDERKPSGTGNGRNMKRSVSNPRPNNSGGSSQGGTRPSSRSGGKKVSTNAPESGSDTNSRRGSDTGRKPDARNRSQGNNRGVPNRRPSQGGARGGSNSNSTTREQPAKPTNAASPPTEGSDALSSLQRVIADLKTTSPVPPAPASNPLTSVAQQSTLPANAPVFTPGASAYPGNPNHRKAASMGAGGYSGMNNFSPNLGSMMEDAEDGTGNATFEEGEIQDNYAPQQPTHQPRSQSQSFVPPRFAALAAAQQDHDNVGPTGRPQLAPGLCLECVSAESLWDLPSAKRIPVSNSLNSSHSNNINRSLLPKNNKGRAKMAKSLVSWLSRLVHSYIIAIQNQIEALQQHQQALYQQQLASGHVLSLGTPGLAPNRGNAHRRVQSTLPAGLGVGNAFGALQSNMGQFGNMPSLPLGLDNQQGVPRGHGRRHSVNVVNKTPSQNAQGMNIGGFNGQEGFDDGFAPSSFGGHSRQASRADSSWRITEHLIELSFVDGGVGGMQPNTAFASDLAQAQAQLQSLQQFRAAAGGHHHKMPSFSFPNMLPNMMAANMMGLGLGGFNLVQQQQQFQSQLQQQPQRKSLFAPYLPQASLPPLLAAGKLVVGILRVNKRNRSDAYVATEVLDADIYICGSKDRNRALEGDIVAVELLDVDEVWGTKKEKEEKKRKKEENSAYDIKSFSGRKDDKKKDDVEVEGQGLMLFEDEEVTDEIKPQFAGHVVAVVERMPGQLFSGTLGLLRPSSAATKEKQEAERREREGDRGDEPRRAPIERPKIVWFKPTDKRVPLIAIPTEQAPPDFVQNSDDYVNKLFVACIKRHPISSLHPFGTLVEELGPIGDIEVETSALLKDCNFPTEDFTDNVLKCLPPVPWTISDHELGVRKDLRAERIFTIDPQTAKDLDDALSVKVNEDGTYDVGVHIADVSYFRAVPMLPPALSERLCSLVPGQDRLAFSVVLTFTKDGRVVKKWFGKTVIKSAAQLSYADAQNVIEGKTLGNVAVIPEHNAADIAHDIKVLEDIAKHLRAQRIDNGALSLESLKLSFSLDVNGFPTDCGPVEYTDANRLVAEKTFVERAARLGYTMDVSSSGALMRSFEAVKDPSSRRLLELLCFKATSVLSTSVPACWTLPSTTTSRLTPPFTLISRRQFADTLTSWYTENWKPSFNRMLEQSAHLFLCVLIADLTQRYGPVVRQAKVVGVLDAAFDVLVPSLASRREFTPIKCPLIDDEHLKKVKQNAEQHALKMEVASRSVHDEKALFDEDDADEDEVVLGRSNPAEDLKETSKQRLLSIAKVKPEFEGLRQTNVIVTADLTKSPPVIKVYSVNPYAENQN